jgi:hypothetical protein
MSCVKARCCSNVVGLVVGVVVGVAVVVDKMLPSSAVAKEGNAHHNQHFSFLTLSRCKNESFWPTSHLYGAHPRAAAPLVLGGHSTRYCCPGAVSRHRAKSFTLRGQHQVQWYPENKLWCIAKKVSALGVLCR